MGVKSTVVLTRSEAFERLLDLIEQLKLYNYNASAQNVILEDLLMRLNDLVHDGEGFENYQIV